MNGLRTGKKAMRWCTLLLVMLLLAACGGQSQPAAKPDAAKVPADSSGPASTSAAPAPAKAPEVKPVSLKVGIVNCTPLCGFRFMANEKGFWKEENLTVEFVQNQNNINLTKALVANEIQIQETTPGTVGKLVSEGSYKARIVGAANPGLAFVLYAKKNINTVQDLKGKNIGISTPAALPHVLVQLLMREAGMDPDKDVTWVPAGDNSQRVQALIAGKVDAVASIFDFIPLIENYPNIHVPIRFAKALPKYLQTLLMVPEKMLIEQPDVVERFLTGYSKGIRYALENPEETAKVAAKALQEPNVSPEIRKAVQLYIESGVLTPNLAVAKEQMEFQIDVMLANKEITKKISVDQFWDDKIAKKVEQKLGTWKPKS